MSSQGQPWKAAMRETLPIGRLFSHLVIHFTWKEKWPKVCVCILWSVANGAWKQGVDGRHNSKLAPMISYPHPAKCPGLWIGWSLLLWLGYVMWHVWLWDGEIITGGLPHRISPPLFWPTHMACRSSLGQGSIPCHSSNNATSLTCWATRQLLLEPFKSRGFSPLLKQGKSEV